MGGDISGWSARHIHAITTNETNHIHHSPSSDLYEQNKINTQIYTIKNEHVGMCVTNKASVFEMKS